MRDSLIHERSLIRGGRRQSGRGCHMRPGLLDIYVALTKNNLRKIDPHLLKEYSHVLLELSQSFALVLDVFEKRLELVVVHAANLEHRLQF
jgi:hypothetical protein